MYISWWLLILIILGSIYFGAYAGIKGYKARFIEELEKALRRD